MNTKAEMNIDWLSSQFQDLENIESLSHGGQKQVFSAVHPHDGDIVLKIVHPTADIEQTRREILAVNQVKSDRIPRILESGTISTDIGTCFWIRENRIHGQTLRENLSNGPFEHPRLLRLALQMAEILAAAEEVNIVHRDVKPENIIIDEAGNFWLIDFGIARHLSLESLTATAEIFGKMTLGYAPLEQCRNIKAEIDSRADLFALGVTLYECATGSNPFREGARDVHEVLRRIDNGNFPRLQLSFPSADDFSGLLATLTQRQRIHRPRCAKEAFEWIREICFKEGIR